MSFAVKAVYRVASSSVAYFAELQQYGSLKTKKTFIIIRFNMNNLKFVVNNNMCLQFT